MTIFENKMENTHIQSEDTTKTGTLLKCIVYLFTFGIAEYITYYVSLTGGVVFYFVILLSLLIGSAVSTKSVSQRFWLVLGLIPIIRIVSLVTPAEETSEIFWYILSAIPVIAAIVALMRSLKLNAADVGLSVRSPLIQFLLAIAGLGLGFIDYLILKPNALNSQLTIQMTVFPALVLLVLTGFVEEIAFRGLLQREARSLGSWGWVFIASVYAVLQIGQASLWHCLFALAVGLYFGWVVKKTGSIWGAALSHGLLNIGLFLIFPHLF